MPIRQWVTSTLHANTINHDHMALTDMFNAAWSPQFRFMTDNPASHVPKPNPQMNGTGLPVQMNGKRLKHFDKGINF